MPELVLVVSIIGVLSALSYPAVKNFTSANDLAEARSKAEALTAAKSLFYRTDPDAQVKWSAALNDESRFDLLDDYLFSESAESTLLAYAAAEPYDAFILGEDLQDPVTVVNDEPDDGSNGNGILNHGHGNNEDSVDVSNPGNGYGGPNGEEDPSGDFDDEIHGQPNLNGNANS